MPLSSQQLESVITKASHALAEYCMNAEIHTTVTGISGGLDSAVTLALAKRASQNAISQGFELRALGLILPCHSDPDHAILAKQLIQQVGAELIEVDLTGVYDHIEAGVLKPLAERLLEYQDTDQEGRYRTSQGNVKARLRMALGTYYVANMVNGLVLSTDNYSEYWMGFWTLHGDVGDFGMIQELWKGDELIQIAEYLDIPREILAAAPTDGLGVQPGGDEAQLGAPYPIVDRVLKDLLGKGIDLNGDEKQLDKLPQIDGIESELVKKIAKRALNNAFKRRHSVNLSRKDLGLE